LSQPASFNEPRDQETVLSCKHITRKLKTFYVGDKNGLGMFIRSKQAGDFWVRWIVLCWWCNLWRWLLRREPLAAASCKSAWIAEENQNAANNQDR
jgi:hypothetical protein